MFQNNELLPNCLMTGKELQKYFGVSLKTVKRWMAKERDSISSYDGW